MGLCGFFPLETSVILIAGRVIPGLTPLEHGDVKMD